MFGTDKCFILARDWCLCTNEGRMDRHNEILRDNSGKPISNRQTTVFIAAWPLLSGNVPKEGDKVRCLYDLEGKAFWFEGTVSVYSPSSCTVTVDSDQHSEGIKEICNIIDTNYYI